MRVLYWMESFSGSPGGIQRLGLEAMKALEAEGFAAAAGRIGGGR